MGGQFLSLQPAQAIFRAFSLAVYHHKVFQLLGWSWNFLMVPFQSCLVVLCLILIIGLFSPKMYWNRLIICLQHPSFQQSSSAVPKPASPCLSIPVCFLKFPLFHSLGIFPTCTLDWLFFFFPFFSVQLSVLNHLNKKISLHKSNYQLELIVGSPQLLFPSLFLGPGLSSQVPKEGAHLHYVLKSLRVTLAYGPVWPAFSL